MAKNKKEKNWFLVELEILCRNVLIIWGDKQATKDALMEFRDEDTVDELLEDFTFRENGRTCYTATHNAYFIWVPQKPTTAKEMGDLAHEIFHAVFALALNIGATPSQDSEEFYAYTIGFLTKRILEEFNVSFSYLCHGQESESGQMQQQTSPSLESSDSLEVQKQ